MKRLSLSLLSIGFLAVTSFGQNLLTYTLPQGNTILQLSGADAITTVGGDATAELRTVYFLADDFGDAQPNTHDWTFNTAWPYVYVSGAVNVDAQISASISTFDDGDPLTGDVLLIEGNPVYQYIGDNSTTDANGNFGPWYFIETDGSATQSTIPEPSAYAFLGGLMAILLVAMRRRRGRRLPAS